MKMIICFSKSPEQEWKAKNFSIPYHVISRKGHGMTADIIPGNGFKSPKCNTIGEINQLHQKLSEIMIKKHGVSIRHVRRYPERLVFTRKLK